MVDPTLIRAFADLGALGFAVIAIWWYATGRGRVGALVDKDKADAEARHQAELLQARTETAEWRKMAMDAGAAIPLLTSAVEKLTGKDLP